MKQIYRLRHVPSVVHFQYAAIHSFSLVLIKPVFFGVQSSTQFFS